MAVKNKKFGVLLCADDTEYVKKVYGGYFGVFTRMLEEEGETWELFRVTSGEFPDDDELETYDGFVVTGSRKDAHGTDAWICRLLAFLKKLDSLKKKVLGICFGHQRIVGAFVPLFLVISFEEETVKLEQKRESVELPSE
ncbi:hypothetical protein L484_014780 [Morus notabilis]|uniref:Glutamine amidotransferase domain-containing protein n=1 Tax=Morus notabilis TaxID=981085 RepID=W9SA75_9ROSA|nr:hypothetical protein L484_014780 [Morus notabilis]